MASRSKSPSTAFRVAEACGARNHLRFLGLLKLSDSAIAWQWRGADPTFFVNGHEYELIGSVGCIWLVMWRTGCWVDV